MSNNEYDDTPLEELLLTAEHGISLALKHEVVADPNVTEDVFLLAEVREARKVANALMQRIMNLQKAQVLEEFGQQLFDEATEARDSNDYNLGRYTALRDAHGLAQKQATEAREAEYDPEG